MFNEEIIEYLVQWALKKGRTIDRVLLATMTINNRVIYLLGRIANG